MTLVLEKTNIEPISGDGITAAGGNEYVVEQNVHVSATGYGYVALADDTALVNFGGVYSATTAGAKLGGSGHVFNEVGGSITGATGVLSSGSFDLVRNSGSILGLAGPGFDHSAGAATLDNRGYLYGDGTGVEEHAAGMVIDNSGTIEATQYAIWIHTGAGLTTSVHNEGTIRAGFAGVHVSGGTLSLVNAGTIQGGLDLGGGDDVIVNTGRILNSQVFLGSGNDTFNGAGGREAGGGIYGFAGQDRIIGGVLADKIAGGADKDTLTGGPGGDTFVFSLGDSVVGAGRDVITDFRHAQHDRIDLVGIDANANIPGDQAFTFIGSDSFAHYHALHPSVIGMLRFAGGTLQANVNSNLAADFEVKVIGAAHLAASDFVL